MASTAHTKGQKYPGHKARPKEQANPRGRSESKPTNRMCVAGQSKDRRPTGNWTGGDACPVRDTGGSMIPIGTREVHQHTRNHERSQPETIMREQRPGDEGSRVPAKERRQEDASQQNRRSGEGRGRHKQRSSREGNRSEITIFQRYRPYQTGLSGDSAIPESRATGATTSPIA